ncbi:MAG: BamA/TamA family outer membrane protein [Rickettsiales bacterium]|jgi:hemolysin activation/secretion protein|nr:BamA/TamA family outer membrane protein [Rickettsiales bacterium]
MSRFLFVTLFYIIFLFSSICLAQTSTQLETGVGIFDRDISRRPSVPLSLPQIVIQEDRQPSHLDATIQFRLDRINIDGSTVYTEAELLEPYVNLNGQNISLEIINTITSELTAKYRNAGYLLTLVVVPPQELDSGGAVVTLRVIEGSVKSVQYVGDDSLVQKFKSYFRHAEKKIIDEKPLKHQVFERELLLAQDLPGIEVSSTFKESTEPGGSDLILEIKKKVIDATFSWNNSGTESAGPGQSSINFGINTLPLIGARTNFNISWTDNWKEYYSLQIEQSYRIYNGLDINVSFAKNASPEPDTDFARTFDYETSSETLSFDFSYPIIRTRDLNLRLNASFDHRNSDSKMDNALYTSDKLRWVSIKTDFDFSDEFGGVTQIVPMIIKGLNVFNATNRDALASNPLAGADYFIVDLYVSRTQLLPKSITVALSGQLRLGDSSLPSFHKFSFGGSQFGRGYDSGVMEGDSGLGLSLETSRTFTIKEKINLTPYVFMDWGKVWDKTVNDVAYDESGSSFGGGLRIGGHLGPDFFPRFNVNFYVGKPLKKTTNSNYAARYIIEMALIF